MKNEELRMKNGSLGILTCIRYKLCCHYCYAVCTHEMVGER